MPTRSRTAFNDVVAQGSRLIIALSDATFIDFAVLGGRRGARTRESTRVRSPGPRLLSCAAASRAVPSDSPPPTLKRAPGVRLVAIKAVLQQSCLLVDRGAIAALSAPRPRLPHVRRARRAGGRHVDMESAGDALRLLALGRVRDRPGVSGPSIARRLGGAQFEVVDVLPDPPRARAASRARHHRGITSTRVGGI